MARAQFPWPPERLEDVLLLSGFLALARFWGELLRLITGGPTCVGEFAAGLFMGPTVGDWVAFPSELAEVSLFGLMALLFTAGIRIRFDNVWLDSNRVFAAAFLFSFLPGVLTYLVLLAFRFSQKESIAGGVAMLPASTRSAMVLHALIEPFERVSSQSLIPAAFISDCVALISMTVMLHVGVDTNKGWWPPLQSVIASIILVNVAIVLRRLTPIITEPILDNLSFGQNYENKTRVLVLEMAIFVTMAAVGGGLMIVAQAMASSFALGALLAGVAMGQSRALAVLWERRTAKLLSWLTLLFFACFAGFAAPPDFFEDVEGMLGGLAIAGAATAGRVLPTLMLIAPVREMEASQLSRACQAATCLLAREELALGIALLLRDHISDRSLKHTSGGRGGENFVLQWSTLTEVEQLEMLFWALIITSTLSSCWHRLVLACRGAEPARRFGIGVLWLIRKGKLIVTGFSENSIAKDLGLRLGDILKSVDGHNVLFMVPDAEGNHEARKLLRGPEGSYCRLEMLRLRRQDRELGKKEEASASAPDTQRRSSTDLETYVVHVPRTAQIDAEESATAHY